MEIRQAHCAEQTVYFESQTDRVLIYLEFTAVIVLKYRGTMSLDCIYSFKTLVRVKIIKSGSFQ